MPYKPKIGMLIALAALLSVPSGSIFAVDFVEHVITPVATAGKLTFATPADLDGDGDMDILATRCCTGGPVVWYENDGGSPPAFTEFVIANGGNLLEVKTEDVDGDGDLDVLTTDLANAEVAWHENDGNSPPAFTKWVVASVPGARTVGAADVDGDGDTDILSGSWQGPGELAWHENDGASPPGFTKQTIISGDFITVHTDDLDGDGDVDVIAGRVGAPELTWYENDGAMSPTFTTHVVVTGTTNWLRWVYAEDVDGDGKLDIVSATNQSDTVAWHENDGATPPSFTTRVISTNAQEANGVHAADVDGDGDMDVLSASGIDNKVAWYESDGVSPPGFTEHVISTSGGNAISVFAEDIDGDGDNDVVASWGGGGTPELLAWNENTMAVATVTPSLVDPATGSTVAACITIDIAGHPDPLGSHGGTLSWDPAVLDYVGFTGGDAPFDSPTVNAANVGSGSLGFSDADAVGASGEVFVLCVDFDVIGAAGTTSTLDLELTSLFAAGTFEDLLASATVNDATVDVVLQCTVGDVNGDSSVNSGDALIILSNEILLPIPVSAEERIAARCGDANGDGNTDSTDAGIVLSFEVGLDTSGFLVGGSNETFDDCTFWGGGLAPALAGPSVRGTIISRLVAVPTHSRWRQEFEVMVIVDTTESGAALGSYGASLDWDPGMMRFLGASGGNSLGFGSPLQNQAEVEEGTLRFAHASPEGAAGRVELVRVRFRALHRPFDPKRALSLTFSSMASPGPDFDNLLPLLEQETERQSESRGVRHLERR